MRFKRHLNRAFFHLFFVAPLFSPFTASALDIRAGGGLVSVDDANPMEFFGELGMRFFETDKTFALITARKWSGEDSHYRYAKEENASFDPPFFKANESLDLEIYTSVWQSNHTTIHIGGGLGGYRSIFVDPTDQRSSFFYQPALSMSAIGEHKLPGQTSIYMTVSTKKLYQSRHIVDGVPEYAFIGTGLSFKLF